jgi:hypothetical protein
MAQEHSQNTIKLSFMWLLFGFIVMFGLGIAGGLLGQHLNKSAVVIPRGSGDKFVTNVQQVTVTPNKNTAQLVTAASRSLLLLVPASPADAPAIGMGVMLTNDGLLATTATFKNDKPLMGITATGAAQPLEFVGTDAVYGLTYLREKSVVTIPVDIAADEPSVGAQLLGLGRSATSGSDEAWQTVVTSYVTGNDKTAPALQRLMNVQLPSSEPLAGTPLLSDDGKLVGVTVATGSGLTLSAADVQASLGRVVSNKREDNPFTTVGMVPSYGFTVDPTSGQRQFRVTVGSVIANSPAALAGIKAQDTITNVANNPVTWTEPIITSLSAPLPLQLTVVEKGQTKSVTLALPASPTP